MDKDRTISVRYLGPLRLEMQVDLVDLPGNEVELTQAQFEAEIELAWADQVH